MARWKNLGFVPHAAVAFLLVLAGNALAGRLDSGWEYHQGGLGGIWEVWRGSKASDNVVWTPIRLPHCFNAFDAVDPNTHYYQGPGWYRTRVAVANPFRGGRALLHFEGAGQKTQVYVGLEKVGPEHIGGYDEFTVDITEAAAKAQTQDGTAPVAVMCDNSRDLEMIPSNLSDFTLYGGLYRHVELNCVPAISLAGVHIGPSISGAVKVRARLYNPAPLADEVEVSVVMRGPDGAPVLASSQKLAPWTGEKEIAAGAIPEPKLWSPSHPALYDCVVTIKSAGGEHSLSSHFGFRSYEFVEHGPFKLNGERLLLRGTQYHQDHAGVGAAVSDGDTRQALRMIKEMGANFVRLGHYQQSPLVLDLCDQLGLLVWEEIPWCRGGIGGERYRQQARDMLSDLIGQHYNHPSIILWGLGNEDDWPGDFEKIDTNQIRAFMSELNEQAHKLDPSRLTCIRRCEFCKDIPGVYSPSIWAGWYSGRYTEYRASVEKEMKSVKRFFHAEWGGDSHAGRHSEEPEKIPGTIATGNGTAETGLAYKRGGGNVRFSNDGDWSETYICNLFDWHLKEQETMTNLSGSAQWIFEDFATPLRPENPIPRVNEKGLTERDLTPKEGYYVFQSYWAAKPMVRLYGHTWPVRWGEPGEKKMVRVYSNCGEVELFVNGRSAGINRRNSADFPCAGLRWMELLKEGTNTLKAVGRQDGREVEDEITFDYTTDKWGAPSRLDLQEIAREGDVLTIEARVYDSSNNWCLDATNIVRFSLAGDGRLLDDLGTVRGSRVVQLANGHACISAKLAGLAAAGVAANGLPAAFLHLGPPVKVKVAAIDRARILKAADAALAEAPVTITAWQAKLSEGGPNDFYSNGDYWWPDPSKPGGLPYIQRDGQSNPGNFTAHRAAMRKMSDAVAALGAAYKLTGDDRYAAKSVEFLRVFFLDPKTRMNPNLEYAQAVPGVSAGRGTGIIDGLHMIEVPLAAEAMKNSAAFPLETLEGLRDWFGEMAQWMATSKNGRAEAAAKNNHSAAFDLQLAIFSRFAGDEARVEECRRRFKTLFVPRQMAENGSFPAELARTKPYGYSIFQLDNMAALCQVLSRPDDNLWTFALPDGRGIRKAMEFLYPFLADKSKWTRAPDVQAWNDWPSRQPSLLFAGLALGRADWAALWEKLSPETANEEVRRNIAITQPLLWLKN
ncbi:MAG TPA: alginate lyase family protein [Verrucomicrobiae bacterium]